MRVSLLFVLVPAIALADASTPPKRATPSPRVLEWWIDSGATRPHCGPMTNVGCDMGPFAFEIGGKRVTVGFNVDLEHFADFKIHVRVDGGGELVLEPAGQGFLSRTGGNVSAELVENVAPVPLIKVSSRPEACSDYWDIFVSVVDGMPRQALALYSVADPPAMQSSTVKFARDGTAVVTTKTSEDEKVVRTTRTRYRFDGRVYVAVPKRGGANSK